MALDLSWRETYLSRQQAIRQDAAAAAAGALFAAARFILLVRDIVASQKVSDCYHKKPWQVNKLFVGGDLYCSGEKNSAMTASNCSCGNLATGTLGREFRNNRP